MLPHHRDRLLQAAQRFQFHAAVSKIQGDKGLSAIQSAIEAAVDSTSKDPLRVKALLSHDGIITVESNATPAVALENLYPASLPFPEGQDPAQKMKVSALTGGALTLGQDTCLPGAATRTNAWTIKPDTATTSATDYTSYKTTSRDMYDEARARVGIVSRTEPKEVLIVSNLNGEVMEGSLTTVYFWRNGRWVTPPVESGGQIGTTRRWALDKRLCEEEVVTKDSLLDGEECWVSNGVRGFIWGRVSLT